MLFPPFSILSTQYSIAAEGRRAGRMFGYGVEFPDDNGSWQMIDGTTFDLSTLQPDNLFVYCLNADDEPHFLHALTYNDDGFLVAETAAEAAVCESTSTLLPDAFEQGTGALALPFGPNYVYDGNSEGNKVELLAAFADPANYKASNIPYEIKSNATPFSTLSNVAALVAVPMVVASLWFL